MRFTFRLTVAGLCLALPGLAMASGTSLSTMVKVTGSHAASYTDRVRSVKKLPECSFEPGHQNGWIVGIAGGRGWSLGVWAVNSSDTNPSANNVNLTSSNHFEAVYTFTSPDGKSFQEWAAGRQIQNHGIHQGSGTFSIHKVRMSGLPDASQGVKYVLTGALNASLPGATTYYDDVNMHLHANVTRGRVHASASFTCWLAPDRRPGGK